MTAILGISAYYHDSAAALLVDGRLVAAAQEERFTRKKHDSRFPGRAAAFCLRRAGLTARELSLVAFYEKPFVKFERLLATYVDYAPAGLRSFLKAMPLWFGQKLWIKQDIRRELNYDGEIIFPSHHLSHAASAFFPSPFSESAVLTVDGVGEWATTSYGIGRGNSIRLMSELRFPHSLGLLYSAFTYYLGFRVNSGEYKVMGLAPYGEPRYKDLILRELLDLKADGSFHLNMNYFAYPAGLVMTTPHFHALFGNPPRKPETELRQVHMDIAASVQGVTNEIMVRLARQVRRCTGMSAVCLAGGVALNCVANAAILRSGVFDRIWIQPAAGDAGGAVGAAFFAWYQYQGNSRTADQTQDTMSGTYLGPEFSQQYIEDFLKQRSIPYQRLTDQELPAVVADIIAREQVVGWFQGRMEFGPRALGNRSILGDARSPHLQEIMNVKIKYRESFRPFAPAIAAERAAEYFEITVPSEYMMLTAPIRTEKRSRLTDTEEQLSGLSRLAARRSELPAVTHIDYSARLQTVSAQSNPRFHRLLAAMANRHQCPVVINTSFNVRGEPIVCTPEDAYECFMHTRMDYMVLGNCLVAKPEQAPLDLHARPWRRFVPD